MEPSDYGPFPYTPINRRPILRWPNGARLALWVIPNIEFFSLKRPITLTECKVLNVGTNIKRQSLAIGPVKDRAFVNWRVAVAVVCR